MNRLKLSDLQEKQKIKVTAGEEPNVTVYKFEVLKSGNKPECSLIQIGPDTSIVGPAPVILEGSGRWTDRNENPVQRQERAFSIGYGYLSVGGLLTVLDLESGNGKLVPYERFVFEDHSISRIEVQEQLQP